MSGQPEEPEQQPPDSVGSARLTCGRHPSQTPPAQVSPKREDLTWENTILIMVLVDRLVDRLSAIRVTVMSWVRSHPDT